MFARSPKKISLSKKKFFWSPPEGGEAHRPFRESRFSRYTTASERKRSFGDLFRSGVSFGRGRKREPRRRSNPDRNTERGDEGKMSGATRQRVLAVLSRAAGLRSNKVRPRADTQRERESKNVCGQENRNRGCGEENGLVVVAIRSRRRRGLTMNASLLVSFFVSQGRRRAGRCDWRVAI